LRGFFVSPTARHSVWQEVSDFRPRAAEPPH
jgi:hypothetical protein